MAEFLGSLPVSYSEILVKDPHETMVTVAICKCVQPGGARRLTPTWWSLQQSLRYDDQRDLSALLSSVNMLSSFEINFALKIGRYFQGKNCPPTKHSFNHILVQS